MRFTRPGALAATAGGTGLGGIQAASYSGEPDLHVGITEGASPPGDGRVDGREPYRFAQLEVLEDRLVVGLPEGRLREHELLHITDPGLLARELFEDLSPEDLEPGRALEHDQ